MTRAAGSSLPRFDARSKVSGALAYPADLNLPGQLHLAIRWADLPHARITRFDPGPALAAGGVVAVFGAADVPINEYGLNIRDQEVLCGRVGGVVRSTMDNVAVVVAETEAQARAAANLIEVAYEPLPGVFSIEEALATGAPMLHPERGDSNILKSYRIRYGDIEDGFAQADIIIEHTYRTHPQEHAYLQPEAGTGLCAGDGKIEVIVAGQWLHEDQEQVAHALGLPLDRIVVRYVGIGGAFGGREDMSVQIVLALAACRLGRPIKTQWTRGESIRGHHKRHAMQARARLGATKDGKLAAAHIEAYTDAGAYAYTSTKVLGNFTLACLGPYEIPNVWVDASAVYTNNLPAGAFRGFGGPQGHWIAENQMNRLAQALEMDPVELRSRNVWREGSRLATGSQLPAGVTVDRVLEAAAGAAGWAQDDDGWAWQAGKATGMTLAPGPPCLLFGYGGRCRSRPQGPRHWHRLCVQKCRVQPGLCGRVLGHGGASRRWPNPARGRAPRRGRGGPGIASSHAPICRRRPGRPHRARGTDRYGYRADTQQRQRQRQPYDVHGRQRHSGGGAAGQNDVGG